MWLPRALAFLLFFPLQLPSDDHLRAALEVASKDSPDGTDFAETPGYRELIAALIELKPPDVEAHHPAPLDAAGALAGAAAQRGSWVRARGRVLLKRDIPLSSPVGNVTKVVRTIMLLESDTRIACDLIGDPPPFKSQADTIEVSGVFFRTVAYETATKKQVTLPYVLARSMELVDTPASTLGKSLVAGGSKLLLGVVFGLIGVIALVFYLRHSARSET